MNNINTKKVLGWSLIVVGLAIIIISLYSTFNIFTNRASAPEIFKSEAVKIEVGDSSGSWTQNIQDELKKIADEQISKIIPTGFLSKILNLISWSIFAGIMFFGGSKLAGIGISLLREV